MSSTAYDVAIVGAGPAGCAGALAYARKGARVLLLEADPRACDRLAGEWLHPNAVQILDSLGVDLTPASPYATGKGFVLFPDDGSEPIVLPYAAGRFGLALEHALLVETMRAHCEREHVIEYVPWARATRIDGQTITYEKRTGGGASFSTQRTVRAPLIVGASGRAVQGVRGAGDRGVASGSSASSRMAGVTLEGANLPFEGYLHIFVGGPGPVIAYRVDARRLRVLCDVPLSLPIPREGGVALFEGYGAVLPEALRPAFRDALRAGPPAWASNELRPRVELGREGLALIGDAVGSHHPLAAIGLTLALEDAIEIARASSFAAYRRVRAQEARVPEMLAVGLYEVFADDAEEVVAIRRAVYETWREKPSERLLSMGFLSGEDRSHLRFGRSFLRTMLRGTRDFVRDAMRTGRVIHTGRVASDLGARMAWLLGGTMHLTDALPARVQQRIRAPKTAEERYGAALRASAAKGEVVGLPRPGKGEQASQKEVLRRAVRALIAEQADDGSLEGEVGWSPMLAAQYVIAWHAMGRALTPQRRASLLKHFERTRLSRAGQPGDGAWSIGAEGEPSLFATTLVFVAARLLGLAKEDPLIARAHEFVRAEGGAVSIPTWGKLWLAIAGLYEWEGVSPILPEAWRTPRWLPVHPSRYYCHTRQIFLGMAVIYGEKWHGPISPRVLAIRDELFPGGYDKVDFVAARESLREGDLVTPWSPPLKISYRVMALLDRVQSRGARAQVLAELRESIRYELRSTSHACISPVSGLLDQIALHIEDPGDPDLLAAKDRFETWIWEDEIDGARVSGARSATWDTSAAAQALATAAPHLGAEAEDALAKCDAFLATQQIRRASRRERDHDRIDPSGGYCFAGPWHGWPVSECTAEAMLARTSSPRCAPSRDELEMAARFVLRCQNGDGGFGSYEPRRAEVPLEWVNPAEMFGDAMLEKSSVECTGSCIAALAAYLARDPGSPIAEPTRRAITRAVSLLRRTQRPDGSWPGNWGIHFVYGTMHGVRGLLAGGVPAHDPQVRRACAFLSERQKPDGSWGEHRSSVLVDRWVDHEEGQVVQTAWALITLLEAQEPDFSVIERGARFLAARQQPDGTWPKQDPEGVFFHAAVLDYALYRRYFPVRALGLYETRRTERDRFHDKPAARARSLHV